MEFATDSDRAAYERVRSWLDQLFGESAELISDDRPSFRVRSGAETVFVHMIGDGEPDESLILLRTWPCDRRKVPDSALRRMLELNSTYPIGALFIESLGEVEFSYGVLERTLNKDTFRFLFLMFIHSAAEARAELRQFVT